MLQNVTQFSSDDESGCDSTISDGQGRIDGASIWSSPVPMPALTYTPARLVRHANHNHKGYGASLAAQCARATRPGCQTTAPLQQRKTGACHGLYVYNLVKVRLLWHQSTQLPERRCETKEFLSLASSRRFSRACFLAYCLSACGLES